MASLIAISCSERNLVPVSDPDTPVPLSLSVITVPDASKSMITEETLHDGAEIGICLTGPDSGTYDGISYSNVRFTADGSSASQSWLPDTDVMLSSTEATLYAYYPYSDEISDIGNIPVETSSQTDYLYSSAVTGMNNHNAEATVNLRHALAAVRISLSRGTYSGTGAITGLSISGANMATGGILNATDGTITDYTGTGEPISPLSANTTIGNSQTDFDILTIPTGNESGITVELLMDSEVFAIETEPITLTQGTIAILDISINNSSITVTPVKVCAWTNGPTSSKELGKNWNVSLEGDTEGMTFTDSTDDDGTTVITVTPDYAEAEINAVTISGTVISTQEVNPENGVMTIRLSEIESDITIDFNGYCLWVTGVYNITNTSSATRLLYMKSYPNKTQCLRMKVDGTEVTAANNYTFNSVGEHIVKFVFPDRTKIPESAFYKNENLKSISIPEGVKHLSTYSFYTCSILETAQLPQSLISSGYDIFSYCQKLKSVSLPDDMQIGYSFFKSCSALESVQLPKNLQNLPSHTFSNCTNLKNINLPVAINTIEDYAFNNCGITSLSIPDNVKTIPENMCYSCSYLQSVTLPAGLKIISPRAFMWCTTLSHIYSADTSDEEFCINIPDGVESIGYEAFFGCNSMQSSCLPSSLIEIGYKAFTSTNMNTISIATANPVYEKVGDFNGIIEKDTGVLIFGCSNATVVPTSVTTIGDYAYSDIPISTIDLHDGITSIGNYAFYNTQSLKTIISRSITPPALSSTGVFYQPTSNGTLYVPSSAIEAYTSEWLSDSSSGYLGYYNWQIKNIEEY